jgi:hypothetical protein
LYKKRLISMQYPAQQTRLGIRHTASTHAIDRYSTYTATGLCIVGREEVVVLRQVRHDAKLLGSGQIDNVLDIQQRWNAQRLGHAECQRQVRCLMAHDIMVAQHRPPMAHRIQQQLASIHCIDREAAWPYRVLRIECMVRNGIGSKVMDQSTKRKSI